MALPVLILPKKMRLLFASRVTEEPAAGPDTTVSVMVAIMWQVRAGLDEVTQPNISDCRRKYFKGLSREALQTPHGGPSTCIQIMLQKLNSLTRALTKKAAASTLCH